MGEAKLTCPEREIGRRAAMLAARAAATPAFAGKTLTLALWVARSPRRAAARRRPPPGLAVFTAADVMQVLR